MPWLVVATLGLLLGDLLAVWQLPPSLLASFAAGGAALALFGMARYQPGTIDWARCGVALLALALGFANADRVYRPVLPAGHIGTLSLPATVRFEGRLARDPERRGVQTRMIVAVERRYHAGAWQEATGLLSLSIQGAEQRWGAGDRVQGALTLRRPRNFGNPAELDYEAHLARQGIYATGFAYDDRALQREPAVASWSSAMSRWRRATRTAYRQALPLADAQLLEALVLGSQRELPIETQDAFRRTGTSHILAISGLNVGLVAAAAYVALRWLLARSQQILLLANVQKLATLLSLLPVILYAGIAGTNVATVRALAMAAVLLGAILVERRQRSAVSLAAAAALVLLLWPGSGRDPSFQLSFVAVAGLMLGMGRFGPWWRERARQRMLHLRGWRGSVENVVAVYLAVSVSAMAATVPLVAYHFNQLSLIAPLANAVVVPLLGSVAVGLGLLAAVASLLWEPLAWLFAWLSWPALWIGRNAVMLFAAAPLAAVRVPSLTVLELAVVYGGLIAALLRLRHLRHAAWASLLVIGLADAGWWCRERYFSRDLAVTFLSVGQGDCAVVELPGGEVMVVDGGGLSSRSFDVGERIVAPFLWSRKIVGVDYLVLSHPQWDHYSGLGYLAEQFAPRQLWWNGKRSEAKSFVTLLERLERGGAELVTMKRGLTRSLDSVAVRVLAPERIAGVSPNDSSLVLSLAFGGEEILFTGDIERDAEGELVRNYGEQLRAAVLKVPHHGSATSSGAEFLERVQPRYAVMSLGFANRFGFPNPAVLRRYRAIGTETFRTDVDGAVAVRISPEGKISIRPTR
ncbi:MAG TPA: DNA internalization-related competence protein ComEC/Rec2 [Terriglobales bacterium]|nr:DNA internalization-related competence protein ComEC/Rec2 [Terriglobales bacterium]